MIHKQRPTPPPPPPTNNPILSELKKANQINSELLAEAKALRKALTGQIAAGVFCGALIWFLISTMVEGFYVFFFTR